MEDKDKTLDRFQPGTGLTVLPPGTIVCGLEVFLAYFGLEVAMSVSFRCLDSAVVFEV